MICLQNSLVGGRGEQDLCLDWSLRSSESWYIQSAILIGSLSKTLYPLLSTGSIQEGASWYYWKIVDWDVKNQINQTNRPSWKKGVIINYQRIFTWNGCTYYEIDVKWDADQCRLLKINLLYNIHNSRVSTNMVVQLRLFYYSSVWSMFAFGDEQNRLMRQFVWDIKAYILVLT